MARLIELTLSYLCPTCPTSQGHQKNASPVSRFSLLTLSLSYSSEHPAPKSSSSRSHFMNPHLSRIFSENSRRHSVKSGNTNPGTLVWIMQPSLFLMYALLLSDHIFLHNFFSRMANCVCHDRCFIFVRSDSFTKSR